MQNARAVVLTGPRQVDVREVPIPETGADDGILEIESNGLCGSDVELFAGALPGYPIPMVLGHEPVGRILRVGPAAAERWGVQPGDRVAVNSAISCGSCDECAAGRECRWKSYGVISADEPPHLWGGMASHLYLHPRAELLKIAPQVSVATAAFHNPLANGFEWAVRTGGAVKDAEVVVLGAGPRGIACVIAAISVGARVTLAGLERDRARLDLAREMGALHAAVLDGRDLSELRDALGTEADVVVDTTPHSGLATGQGVTALRAGGRLVLAGIKGPGMKLAVDLDAISLRQLSLVGPVSKSRESLRQAVDLVNVGHPALEKLTTRAYGLADLPEAIAEVESSDVNRPIHVRLEP